MTIYEERNETPFAVEFDSKKRTFVKREYPIAGLKAGRILIEVTCCTICGSDLHTFCGRRCGPERCVLGHEIIGRVASWDGNTAPQDFFGQPIAKGQRVTWAMATGCGECFYCRNNLGQKCESLFKYGHEPAGTSVPSGGLSHFCALEPGTPVFKIPDAIPDEVACPANCATATVSAAMRLVAESHPVEGSSALVIGAGMLGLTAMAQLSNAGASQIISGDVSLGRLKLASEFGATEAIDMTNPANIKAPIAALTKGRGVDIALDFAGVLPAVNAAIENVRVGGCVLLAGSVFPTQPISIVPEDIVRRMLTVRGLHNYLPRDLASGLRFLESCHAKFPFRKLVSNTFPLGQVLQAFEYARDHQPIRVAIRPQV